MSIICNDMLVYNYFNKQKIILLFFFFCLLSLQGFSQDWLWAKSIGSVGEDLSSLFNSVNKSNGDIYFTGTISGTTVVESETLTCNGQTDILYGKYDANGNILWLKRAGGALGGTTYDDDCEKGGAIYYDSLTNAVYLTGMFNGTMVLGTYTLTSSQRDIFLAKLDVNGNVLWAKKAGGSANDYSMTLSLDNSGNIYISGVISSTNAFFDGFPVSQGGFFAKYDNNGNCIWAKRISQMTSPPEYSVYSINFFDNNLYLTGIGNNSFTIDTITITSIGYNVFISCFNTDGSALWAKQVGSNISGSCKSDMDYLGYIYMIGYYTDSVKFGNHTFYHTASTNTDVFLAKFDVMGNFIWAEIFNGSAGAISYDLIADNNGNVYITGNFGGTVNFGNYTVTATNGNMYVARYDSSGECLGVRNFGYAWGRSVVTDYMGSCIVIGEFWNPVTIGAYILNCVGYKDIYIAKHTTFTGIEDTKRIVAGNNSLVIYANPTTGKCNITVPSEFTNEKNLTLSIYDNNGKVIQKRALEMSEDKVILNLEQEAKGIYNAILSNGKKSYSGKIIFE